VLKWSVRRRVRAFKFQVLHNTSASAIGQKDLNVGWPRRTLPLVNQFECMQR